MFVKLIRLAAVAALTVTAVMLPLAASARAGDAYATMCAGRECLYYENPYGQQPATGTAVRVSTEWAYHHGGPLPNAVSPIPSPLCGGVVTGSCPFRAGSGLNRRYLGDPVIWLAFTDLAPDPPVAGCISSESGRIAIDNGCDRGSDWVAASSDRYLNVRVTNRRGRPAYLHSAARPGGRAWLGRWGRGERWAFASCGEMQPCY